MRKIFAFIAVSADGYHADVNGDLDWPNLDEEFDAFSAEQLGEVDTLLFGRVTYEGMAAFWPTQGVEYNPRIAETMNTIVKVVVSTSLEKADWANTRLVSTDVADELAALKRRPTSPSSAAPR